MTSIPAQPVMVDGDEYAALKRDAQRWRTFNKVAEKHYSHETGSIRFYLPRAGRGTFRSFEETIDDYPTVP